MTKPKLALQMKSEVARQGVIWCEGILVTILRRARRRITEHQCHLLSTAISALNGYLAQSDPPELRSVAPLGRQ